MTLENSRREWELAREAEEKREYEIRRRIREVNDADEVDYDEVQALFSEIGELEDEYMLEILWGLLDEVVDRKEHPERYI